MCRRLVVADDVAISVDKCGQPLKLCWWSLLLVGMLWGKWWRCFEL